MLDLFTMTPQDAMARVQPISELPDNGRFAVADLVFTGREARITGFTYGTKLYSNQSRARVRLEGGQKHVVFGADDRRREFEAAGSAEINYPTMLEVIPLTEEEWDAHQAALHQFRRKGGANTMDEKQGNALKAKYQFTLKKLAKEADEAKKEILQGQIDKMIAQAAEGGLDLNSLETEGKPVKVVNIRAQEKTRVAGQKAAKTATKATKTATPKAARKEKEAGTTYDCLCGCGTECNGLFAPGHDARVKGLMYKVERGEIPFEDLPADVQPLVKMKGRKASAGKDDSDYRVVQSPVKFPGRDDITLVGRDGKPREKAKASHAA